MIGHVPKESYRCLIKTDLDSASYIIIGKSNLNDVEYIKIIKRNGYFENR